MEAEADVEADGAHIAGEYAQPEGAVGLGLAIAQHLRADALAAMGLENIEVLQLRTAIDSVEEIAAHGFAVFLGNGKVKNLLLHAAAHIRERPRLIDAGKVRVMVDVFKTQVYTVNR